MVEIPGKGELLRIEDFIALAKEGKDVNATVELRQQFVSQKIHPGDTEELKEAIDMYLLFGDYTFKIGNWKRLVFKSLYVWLYRGISQ